MHLLWREVLLISTVMAKLVCESTRALSVFILKKHGFLDGWGTSGSIRWTSEWYGEQEATLSVSICGAEPHVTIVYGDTSCTIRLTSTPCNYGGRRFWFVCPLAVDGKLCGRRVAVLYLAGKWFGCRSCYELAYKAQYQPRGRSLGYIGQYFHLAQLLEARSVRTRFWKGRPTKRYARLLPKIHKLRGFNPELVASQLKRALSATR
jgi:hypothetical protein